MICLCDNLECMHLHSSLMSGSVDAAADPADGSSTWRPSLHGMATAHQVSNHVRRSRCKLLKSAARRCRFWLRCQVTAVGVVSGIEGSGLNLASPDCLKAKPCTDTRPAKAAFRMGGGILGVMQCPAPTCVHHPACHTVILCPASAASRCRQTINLRTCTLSSSLRQPISRCRHQHGGASACNHHQQTAPERAAPPAGAARSGEPLGVPAAAAALAFFLTSLPSGDQHTC